MNIFFLDRDTTKCAQYHNDKHVVKMVLEYAQLLSTAHHVHCSPLVSDVYKKTHTNHPSAVWTRSCKDAYQYVLDLFDAVSTEYEHRYGKIHKTYAGYYDVFDEYNPCPDVPIADIPQCMPKQYYNACPVQAYRNYYMGDKRGMATWSRRGVPEWWQ